VQRSPVTGGSGTHGPESGPDTALEACRANESARWKARAPESSHGIRLRVLSNLGDAWAAALLLCSPSRRLSHRVCLGSPLLKSTHGCKQLHRALPTLPVHARGFVQPVLLRCEVIGVPAHKQVASSGFFLFSAPTPPASHTSCRCLAGQPASRQMPAGTPACKSEQSQGRRLVIVGGPHT